MSEQHKYDGGITGWWCRYEYPNGKQCGEHHGNTAVHLPAPVAECMHAPEMLDARLYVFDCQNFVSEKDYRAVLEQLAACRREFFEYRKVAGENEEIGHKALDDLQVLQQQLKVQIATVESLDRARQKFIEERDIAHAAGRREGLRMAEDWVGRIAREVDEHDGYLNFCASIQEEIHRALIDSPKAEGEEPSDDYVAWLQFRQRSFRVCDSDAEGAFRVYRHPAEAEGEESK